MLEDAAPAASSALFPVWEATAVMAMFEQMRANVGKLLTGIDRSEPGRRERFWPSGVEERISGDPEWWSQSRACPGEGLYSHLEEMFKEKRYC